MIFGGAEVSSLSKATRRDGKKRFRKFRDTSPEKMIRKSNKKYRAKSIRVAREAKESLL